MIHKKRIDLLTVGQNFFKTSNLLARSSIVSELGFIISFVWVRTIYCFLNRLKASGPPPFYRYGTHIQLIRFKEYYGLPREHEHDPIYSLSTYARFSGQFFLSSPTKRLQWEKMIVVPCLDVIMVAFFSEKYTVKFSFCPTNARKY